MSLSSKLTRGLAAGRQVRAFLALPPEHKRIVFYSEDDFSFMHFEGLIEELTAKYGRCVCYLTSQYDDPIFQRAGPLLRPFYVGSGWHRTSLFLRMNADVVVMTMPDIETYHVKRSRVADVHYVYLFHAMVSTHSNYRERAFDHYDTIFLTGPHQRDEIRATEKIYGLPEKALVDYGYPRLERLIENARDWRADHALAEGRAPRVILAPSWGSDMILESMGEAVVDHLLRAGFDVTVRPHPVTVRKQPELMQRLADAFGNREKFRFQTDVRDKKTLYEADVMISDWSGVAMEYAFSCERLVVFIDVPKKRNNPNDDRIAITPVEVSIRSEIGAIVSPRNLDQLSTAVLDCVRNQHRFIERIRDVRRAYVFNLGSSVQIGARHIDRLAPAGS